MDSNQNDNQKKMFGKRFILAELILLLTFAWLLLDVISNKRGYHMDELLSFELANAEFNPWIVPTQPQGRLAKFVDEELRGENLGETWGNLVDTVQDVLQNGGGSKLLSYQADVYPEPVWIDRQQFIDYITVDEKDDFQYLSVYFNVKDDNHPPLHFMVLHTVSSIFKGKLTPLMGCGINLACVLGIMLLMSLISQQLLPPDDYWSRGYGRWMGMLSVMLYAVSAGVFSTVLLIRMYAMLTFFCVALLAVHVRKLYGKQSGEQGFIKGNKLLIAVTVLGFLTQYFFLFYCLTLAAVTAVILWRRGSKKELLHYVRAMITAAVIGVAVFPFSIADVFSSGRGVEALANLSSGFAGYGERLAAFGEILIKRVGVGCMAVLSAAISVCVLIRLCVWYRERGQGDGEVGPAGKNFIEKFCLLAFPVLGYFLLAARMSPYLVDRYIMPVFPLVILLWVIAFGMVYMTIWNRCEQRSDRAGWIPIIGLDIVVIAAMVCQGFSALRYEGSYMYMNYAGQEELAREYAAYPCICIGEGVSYYENLIEFTCYERTLILSPEEFENREEKESIASLEQAVLLLKDGLDREKTCEIFVETYGLYPEETLMEAGGAYGDQVILLKRRR